MGEAALTPLPGRGSDLIGKGVVNRDYGPLRPGALRLLVHRVLDHGLHKSVNGEHSHAGIASNQREAQQHLDGFIHPELI